MRCLHLLAWLLPIAVSAHALAGEEESFSPSEPTPESAATERLTDSPAIDYPPLQALNRGSSLYIDHTYEAVDNLSTFWWVKGRAVGYRLAIGGNLQLGALRLSAELPFLLTRLYIDKLGDAQPTPEDQQKTSYSLGDVVGGASYEWKLATDAVTTIVGLGTRLRLPTHTMSYSFGLLGGGTYAFGFPYYFHVAPAGLLHLSYGPFSLTINEGILAMLAKNATLLGIPTNIPNVFFWESHYALSVLPTKWLGFSVELIGCIQLSHVADPNFQNLNHLKAFYVDPAITLDFGAYRFALAGRFGLGNDTQEFGVITFSGSRALLVRVSYLF
jgi:hypothetical protein